MTEYPDRMRATVVARSAVLALGWLSVVVLGWLVYYAAGGGGDAASAAASRTLSLAVALAGAGGLGVFLIWLAERRRQTDPAQRLLVLAVTGWGLGIAMGWIVDASAGGPFTGLVTGSVLVAAGSAGTRRTPLALTLLVGAAGLVVGRLLVGDGSGVVQLVTPAALGLVAFTAAWRLLGIRLPLLPVLALTVGWGLAWVGAYELVRWLPSGLSLVIPLLAEVTLACALGGALTGWVWRRLVRESVWRTTMRWTLAALGGTAAAVVLAQAVWLTGLAPPAVRSAADLLAMGTTFGLGVTAWVALTPTLRRTAVGEAGSGADHGAAVPAQ